MLCFITLSQSFSLFPLQEFSCIHQPNNRTQASLFEKEKGKLNWATKPLKPTPSMIKKISLVLGKIVKNYIRLLMKTLQKHPKIWRTSFPLQSQWETRGSQSEGKYYQKLPLLPEVNSAYDRLTTGELCYPQDVYASGMISHQKVRARKRKNFSFLPHITLSPICPY